MHRLGAYPLDDSPLSDPSKFLLKTSAKAIPIPPGIILTKALAPLTTENYFLHSFVNGELKDCLKEIDRDLQSRLKAKRPGPLFSLKSLNTTHSKGYSFDFIGLSEKNVAVFEPYCLDGKAIYLNFLRFIKDFSSFVFHIPGCEFIDMWEQLKINEGIERDSEASNALLQEACLFFLHIFKKETGRLFPQNLEEQLELLLNAIFDRWHEESEDPINAITRLAKPQEPEFLIQGMVFSNLSAYSGQGTIYSGKETEIHGDYFQKRGCDDLFGDCQNTVYAHDILSLKYLMPSLFHELLFFTKKIEEDLKGEVRIDFTIEEGVLFITHLSKAGEEMASQFVKEELIDPQFALW